jgi:nitrogen regulatory protein PII
LKPLFEKTSFNDVKDALRKIGIVGMNVIEVRGQGRQGGIILNGRSGTYRIDMLPRLQLNIVLSDHNVEKTIETIQRARAPAISAME